MEYIKFINTQQAKLVHLIKNTKENVKNNINWTYTYVQSMLLLTV
jgi:ribosomal protein L30E